MVTLFTWFHSSLSAHGVGVPVGDAGGFYLTWIKGQQEFAAAEKTKADADYETAAKTLAAALDNPQARTDVASAGSCRNLLASCQYNLKKYEEAAQLYQQAAGALKQSGGAAGVEAAWNAFVCYQRLYGNGNCRKIPPRL